VEMQEIFATQAGCGRRGGLFERGTRCGTEAAGRAEVFVVNQVDGDLHASGFGVDVDGAWKENEVFDLKNLTVFMTNVF
jgi:hypothetical protein